MGHTSSTSVFIGWIKCSVKGRSVRKGQRIPKPLTLPVLPMTSWQSYQWCFEEKNIPNSLEDPLLENETQLNEKSPLKSNQYRSSIHSAFQLRFLATRITHCPNPKTIDEHSSGFDAFFRLPPWSSSPLKHGRLYKHTLKQQKQQPQTQEQDPGPGLFIFSPSYLAPDCAYKGNSFIYTCLISRLNCLPDNILLYLA